MGTIKDKNYLQDNRIWSKIKASIAGIIGILMAIPFTLHMMFTEQHPYMTSWEFLWTCMMIVAAPLIVYGIVKFLQGGKTYTHTGDTTSTDLGRIRHAIETDRMTRR